MRFAENQDILDHYGGHSVAAGLSLASKRLPLLKERLEERIAAQLTPFDLPQKLCIDAPLMLSELTKKFVLMI